MSESLWLNMYKICIRRALSFDGIDDYLVVNNFVGSQAFTVAFWIMLLSQPSDSGFEWAFIHRLPDVWYGAFSLTVERWLNGVFRVRGIDGNPYYINASSLYNVGSWTFVTCVCGEIMKVVAKYFRRNKNVTVDGERFEFKVGHVRVADWRIDGLNRLFGKVRRGEKRENILKQLKKLLAVKMKLKRIS